MSRLRVQQYRGVFTAHFWAHLGVTATGEWGANDLQAFDRRPIILGSQGLSRVRIYELPLQNASGGSRRER